VDAVNLANAYSTAVAVPCPMRRPQGQTAGRARRPPPRFRGLQLVIVELVVRASTGYQVEQPAVDAVKIRRVARPA